MTEQKEKNNTSISTGQIWLGILLVALLVGGFFVADIIMTWRKGRITNQDISDKIDKIEKSLTPYEAKDRLNKVVIVENFENSAKNNQPTNSFRKKLVVVGDFTGGYLFVKGSVDNKATKNVGDIYVKLSGNLGGIYKESGGHLIEDKSLETPVSDSITELLFELSDIKYKDSYLKSDVEVTSGDWLKIINGGQTQLLIGFTSTEGLGKILELSLYYECTSGSDCSISSR